MKIRVLCVGKVRESFFRSAIAEYSKRLSRYCRLEIVEVPDEKTPENASAAEKEQIKNTEGKRLLRAVHETDYVIALAIEGKMLDSAAFAREIEQLGVHGISSLSFLIGGSLGLSEEILQRADTQLSFSKMTFPHQLMRVILLEQIYRGYRIIHGEPYHK